MEKGVVAAVAGALVLDGSHNAVEFDLSVFGFGALDGLVVDVLVIPDVLQNGFVVGVHQPERLFVAVVVIGAPCRPGPSCRGSSWCS